MKKSLFVYSSVLAMALALQNCSSGGGAKTPSAELFNSPTGSVTNDNATQVMNDALKSSATGDAVGGLLFAPKMSIRSKVVKAAQLVSKTRLQSSDFSACATVSSDNKTVTLDWGCLQDAGAITDTDCTFSGKTKFVIEGPTDAPTGFEIDFMNWGANCGVDNVLKGVNGQIKSTGESLDDAATIYCVSLDYTFNTVQNSVDQCYLGGKVALDDGSGDTVVCTSITPDVDCATISSAWTDVDGDLTLSCDVTEKDSTCPPEVSGISAVDNCTVTRL